MTDYPLHDLIPGNVWGNPYWSDPAWVAASFHVGRLWALQVHHGPYPRQLTQHAYPGQPSTRAQHVPPLCLCTYTLGPVLIDHPDGYDLVFTPHFVIAPECMHHGHLAHRDVVRRMWDDPYGYGLLRDPYDLDDERKD
jgi:hypothetical protein